MGVCPSDMCSFGRKCFSSNVPSSSSFSSPCYLDENAVVMEVDHDKQVVYTETLSLALHEPELMLAAMQPSEEHVASRLTSPIVSTHLDTKNIAFER